MPAFARYSEATVEEMRKLVTRRDWPGFLRLAAQVAQRAEELGVHAYGPRDRAWLALFLDGEIRGERMELTEGRLVLGEYDRFLGGKCLKDPSKVPWPVLEPRALARVAAICDGQTVR